MFLGPFESVSRGYICLAAEGIFFCYYYYQLCLLFEKCTNVHTEGIPNISFKV